MRRRRRRKVFWFPNLGTVGPTEDADDDDYGLWIQQDLATGQQTTSTFVTDLTFDRPIEEDTGSDTLRLSSVVGGEYILRRIVGNCFVSRTAATTSAQTANGPPVLVTAGFFVARAEDSTQEDVTGRRPIGAETTAELRENYSPASVSTLREPWIWRKRWILGNLLPGTANFVSQTLGAFMTAPSTNVLYPSKHTDASIDARTIRRVGNDDRLWFVVSARKISTGDWIDVGTSPFNPSIEQGPVVVNTHLDYRLLGSLVRPRGKGTF